MPAADLDAIPPGPRGSLLLGMARDLQRDQLGTLERAMTAYGDVVRLDAGPPGRRFHMHLVTHPDGVQQVLAGGAANYVKDTRFYQELAAALGDGLLTSDGQRWRRQRRTLAPLFPHHRIGGYVPVMADEAVRLLRRWTAAGGSPARVDLHAEMVDYTLRVVGRALFGAAVDDAVPTIRATFPVVSEEVRHRATAAVPPPRRRRPSRARRALASRPATCASIPADNGHRPAARRPTRATASLIEVLTQSAGVPGREKATLLRDWLVGERLPGMRPS